MKSGLELPEPLEPAVPRDPKIGAEEGNPKHETNTDRPRRKVQSLNFKQEELGVRGVEENRPG